MKTDQKLRESQPAPSNSFTGPRMVLISATLHPLWERGFLDTHDSAKSAGSPKHLFVHRDVIITRPPGPFFFCCGFQFHVQSRFISVLYAYYPIPVETNVSNVMFIWKYHIASTFLPSDVHLTTITLPPIALCFTGNEPL